MVRGLGPRLVHFCRSAPSQENPGYEPEFTISRAVKHIFCALNGKVLKLPTVILKQGKTGKMSIRGVRIANAREASRQRLLELMVPIQIHTC